MGRSNRLMGGVLTWSLLLGALSTLEQAVAVRIPSRSFSTQSKISKDFPTLFRQPLPRTQGTAEVQKTVNVTVYRITPLNYTGMTNMDTGDAAGDAFFGLYELTFPILCADPALKQLINCENVPILNIPGYNVYTEFLLEAVDRFGEYMECNPNPNTGIFACANLYERYESCWYDDKRWNTTFADLCDRNQCHCHVINYEAVGKGPTPFKDDHHDHPKDPPQCSSQSQIYHNVCIQDQKGKVEPSWTGIMTEADCCQSCNDMGFDECKYWSYRDDISDQGFKTPCHIYNMNLTRDDFANDPNCNTGSHTATSQLFSQIGDLSSNLNGTWYSTEKDGLCEKGQTIGKDCWWRIAETKRTVNATCVNNHLIDNVHQYGEPCFTACPSHQGTNISSTCFVKCLMDTLVGQPYAEPPVPPMPAATIVKAFQNAFLDKPEKDGGCPSVPVHDEAYVAEILAQVPEGQGFKIPARHYHHRHHGNEGHFKIQA
eukprot:CAMPEP_0197860926 /NCGR_PEP_ID=MMETSP1438-20131217/36626_1 /TAXON_ID=1461541 /ORGANISM="Pterosperma sp., Strain CCMP1384" /LENGTH=485 /DNA_ID=CAMNT_0043477941 /DNA_START=92 /DNA_END=1549 /DNA_ORIENTATION=+